jgi:putative nucleotidyltransferase with HDIG domain
MFANLTLTFATLTFVLFLGLLYLYFKNTQNKNFLYAAIPFLCGAMSLLGHYHLHITTNQRFVIFWTKFQYTGLFGYFVAFPLFISSITRRKLDKKVMIGVAGAAVVFLVLTWFSDLIITTHTHLYVDMLRANTGVIYPYAMMFLIAIGIYFYFQIFMVSSPKLDRQFNYHPITVGLAIAFIAGTIDVIGVSTNEPVIPRLPHPFVIGTFVFTIAYFWTFLSQYSWIFEALTKSKQRIHQLVAKSNKSFMEFVQLIAKTLDAKDHYTAGHSLRVMNYALKIANELNLPDEEVDRLSQACLLHDIGKIGIPDGILNKETPLTEEEKAHIYNHPVLGKQMLSVVSDFEDILDVIYSHHERVDGKGYPNGITRDQIPLLARILAVADTFDAMLSERPYRSAKTEKEAVAELIRVRGKQLDAKIVDAFIDTLKA